MSAHGTNVRKLVAMSGVLVDLRSFTHENIRAYVQSADARWTTTTTPRAPAPDPYDGRKRHLPDHMARLPEATREEWDRACSAYSADGLRLGHGQMDMTLRAPDLLVCTLDHVIDGATHVTRIIRGSAIIASWRTHQMPGLATVAITTDVKVDEAHRGRGIGRWLRDFRERALKRAGFRALACSTRIDNAAQMKIMCTPAHRGTWHDMPSDAGGTVRIWIQTL